MFIEFVPGNFERKRAVKKMAESTYDSNGRNFTFFPDQNFANQDEWEEKEKTIKSGVDPTKLSFFRFSDFC